MGKLESTLKTKIRRTKLNQAIIGVLVGAGVISLALVAPNVVGALGKIGFLPQRTFRTRKALDRMINAGYIKIEKRNTQSYLRLTDRGEALAAQMHLGKVVPRIPRHWDKRWRIVMFDIPERRRRLRSQIREILKLFNFYRLQDSVWVYPYDAEELIVLLKADLKIGSGMLYVIADSIENDINLRRVFNLK